MKCKVCSSKNVNYQFNLSAELAIYACTDCDVQFLDPQLSDKQITELYSEKYYQSWGISGDSENISSKLMKIATFVLRLKQIQKQVPKGKVLDIGCATGFFLEAAQKMQYEPYGIELSEYSSKLAKQKFGESYIFNGKLEDCKFPVEFFEVITMFDLIEHVRMPAETLKQASKLLKQDGIIVITTPNIHSLSNKLMGKKWTHYKKEHFFYFTLSSLNFIAKQAKLKIIFSEKSKKSLKHKLLAYTAQRISTLVIHATN